MSQLEAAKALVAQHAAATAEVLDLLNHLTADSATATAAAVSAATSDISGANDLLTQQINASLAQLQEIVATHAGTSAAAAPASPAPVL